MKLQFRKTMLRLAALVALLGIIFLPGRENVARAEGTDAGGTRAEAMEIQVNQTYSEVISSDDDEDYFKFTTTERGYFQVTLAHDDVDSESARRGWSINVLDEEGELLVSGSGIQKSWTSVALPYAKGTTFYIRVLSYDGSYGAINCLYNLTVSQTAAEDWEVELNDTQATATAIETDQTYHGNLLNGNDTDYLRFVTTVHGYFQIQFAHNAADSRGTGRGWNVYVLDEKGEVITSGSNITKNWTSITLPYAEAGRTFYVQVSPYDGSYGAVHCTYDLMVNQTAATDWESEPNETVQNANLIATGKTYHGLILNGSDVDSFRFTTTVNGYFHVQFAHNAADDRSVDRGWDIRILDEAGTTLISDSGIKKNWTSIPLPYAKAGKTFYVQIWPYDGSYGAVHCTYDLTVNQTAATDWEAEPNETLSGANAIAMGKTYHGLHINGSDTDCFRFATSVRGYFQVQFAYNAVDNRSVGRGWDVRILDEAGELIVYGSGIKKNWTSGILPYAGPGKAFYVQVMPYDKSYGALYCTYDLTVNQTAASDWESEPNGTMAGATSIAAGKTYNGITVGSEDQDYYKVNVSSAGKMKVKLKPSLSNAPGSVRYGWDILVYDKKSNEVARLQEVATENSLSLDVKKGTYYIKIEPHNTYSAPAFCQYSITTTHAKAPSKPKISSVKAAKRAATVKWKKVSGASGYYIYRSASKNGEYKKVKTIKKGSTVSWKNKKLTSRQTYYYKVAAYKKSNGMTAVSSYSKVKSVKVK